MTVPSKVTVKESDKGATIFAITGAVSTAATRAINATLNGVTKTAVFELCPRRSTYMSSRGWTFTTYPTDPTAAELVPITIIVAGTTYIRYILILPAS